MYHAAMPVSGLVIVLKGDHDKHAALRCLRDNGRVTVGDVDAGHRVPVVLETESADEERQQMKWLHSVPGVAMVEVAYNDFSDLSSNQEVPDGS